MGKVKNRNGSELEYIRGENKELRAQVKALKRRLRELEKHEHIFEQSDDAPEEEVNMEDTHIRCEDCGKGVMVEFEIMGKVFATCNICSFRKKMR